MKLPLLVAAAAAVIGVISVAPVLDGADNLGIDLLFGLRSCCFRNVPDRDAPPIAVIALDEETYRTPPFKDTPYALWTPEIAGILNAVMSAEPRVVGLDVIFPTAMESRIPGFDRPFLLSLQGAAQQQKIVLSKSQNSDQVVAPFPAFTFAAGGGANVRFVNAVTDKDGVVRRVLIAVDGAQGKEPSFDFDLASRATGEPMRAEQDGFYLGDRRVQAAGDAAPLIDFQDHPIPTYSLADLHACTQRGDADFFKRNFQGRVVLIGAVLDIEDRMRTSARFTPFATNAVTERCVPSPASAQQQPAPKRSFVPGVYVHAAAIAHLASGTHLIELGRISQGVITALIAGLFGMLTAAVRPRALVVALAVLIVAWPAAATAAFVGGVVLPVIDRVVGAGIVSGITFALRFTLADRDKRRIRRAFGYYLPPHLVDQIATSGQMPSLGGEVRDVTLWFSDIAGFTRISEGADPQALVAWLNRYFATVNEIIEAHGGYIDKYLGDAVVAIFGAPVSNPGHAAAAVRAALACQERLKAGGEDQPMTRIGLHTGESLVGNIGSGRRLNYTAIGDAVNLASRLEGANKAFGTSILISAATAAACGKEVSCRELGRIRVVGRQEPVTVFEPLAAPMPEAERSRLGAGLADYYSGRFTEAAESLAPLSVGDPVVARLRERALKHAADRPAEWAGTDDLLQK